ncbi:MAG: PDZ domain-containing protein, partial [bacterium]|nr:PDZ domain-containing protein [bacterium]
MFKSFLKWVPFFAVSLIVLFLTALSSQVEIKQAEPIKDLPIFKRALYFTKQNYVEPGQVDTTKILRSSLREVAKSVDPLVFTLSQNQLDLSMGEAQKKLLLPENCNIQQLSSLLTNSLNFVSDHYKGTSDLEKWEHLTIQGALATLDTHSSFLPPRIFTEFKIGTKGNFGGLGIVVGVRDGELTVITPLEDTPAWAADLKPNDRIVEIDGESTINMPLSEAVEKLRGPVGTTVTSIIHREGRDKDAPIKLQRDLIRIKSV